MNRTFVLGVATALVAGGALLVFLRDLRFVFERRLPETARRRTPSLRALLEAALPLVAVVALLSWAWAAQ